MIQCFIVDDEQHAIDVIANHIKEVHFLELVGTSTNPVSAIQQINEGKMDLVFLDVQMPKINGFEMLELVEEMPAVIFTTAFEEHAIRAFEVNAIDYLLKPFSKDRFEKALQKWLGNKTTAAPAAAPQQTTQLLETAAASPLQSNRIVVKINGKIKIIPVQDVHYLEAADDYVKIITQEGAFLKNKTMSFFEQTLDPQQFARVHRSYMLNVNQVTRIEPYEKENHLAILRTGAKVPVSKTGYPKLKAALGL